MSEDTTPYETAFPPTGWDVCSSSPWPTDPEYINLDKFPDTPENRRIAHDGAMQMWDALNQPEQGGSQGDGNG